MAEFWLSAKLFEIPYKAILSLSFTLRSNEQKENERATHNMHFREYFLDTSFYIWLH